MRASYDFVSPETGKTLLHAALDAAPEGITREDSWEIVRVLRRARTELEKIFCRPVRLSLDSWEGTLFWYLVLFRPIMFDTRHPKYGDKKWSIYELLGVAGGPEDLKMTDLGVFVDRENMWVVLYWPEALKGICADFEDCPSWRKVMSEHKESTGRVADADFMETCARAFSYTVPNWHLEKIDYAKKIFFKEDAQIRDFIALDITGVDIPRLDEATKSVQFPVARHARFAHFYTEDEREYKSVMKHERELQKKHGKGKGKRVVQNARRRDLQKAQREQRRADEKEEKHNLYLISRAIFKIPRMLGGTNPMGRSMKYLSIKKSDDLFRMLVSNFMNGEYPSPKWNKLQSQAELIENLLARNDPHVPEEFWKWTWWKNKAERIRMEFEGG
jgi:hypothetical protein